MHRSKLISIILFSILIEGSCFGQNDAEWIPLFNGVDLSGWKHVGNGGMHVEDGIIKTEGGMGLLYYEIQPFENIQLKVIYNNLDTSNAGVFIRIPEKPTEEWMPVNRGYEVQIDDREDEYHLTGVLYSLTRAIGHFSQPGTWNTLLITLAGDQTKVEVNGHLVTDYREGQPVPPKKEDYEPDRGTRPNLGFIGLQNHGEDDICLFKEVSYRPLH